ncbi:unnamed protein product, partial [Brassica rapa]
RQKHYFLFSIHEPKKDCKIYLHDFHLRIKGRKWIRFIFSSISTIDKLLLLEKQRDNSQLHKSKREKDRKMRISYPSVSKPAANEDSDLAEQ